MAPRPKSFGGELKQSQEMTETMGLTSDTWPEMKKPIEMTQSHQIMEPTGTIPAPPGQGTVPIGMSQKHQAEIVPVIPLVQEMDYLWGETSHNLQLWIQ